LKFKISESGMKLFKLVLIVALSIGSALSAPYAAANPDVIRSEMQKKYPNVTVQSVLPTAYLGLWEIFTGTELFYTDERASYLLLGRLVDVATKTDISTPRFTLLTAIKFDDLPLNLAVKTVIGKGTRKLAVFADPNCGYCKRFESDVTTLADTTVYTFLYPILAADSASKSRKVWCAPDRVKAWQDWMLRGTPLTATEKCENPIEKVAALGQRLGLKATPVSFFADGTKLEGAVAKDILEARMVAATSPLGAATR
jgi:thiol:disulfide interchange protein DsbC